MNRLLCLVLGGIADVMRLHRSGTGETMSHLPMVVAEDEADGRTQAETTPVNHPSPTATGKDAPAETQL